jgi:hypothetical protein
VPKIKLEDTEYIIGAMPPYCRFYTEHMATIEKKLEKEDLPFDEKEKLIQEHSSCVETILKASVDPEPPQRHWTPLYKAVIAETNRVLEQTDFL